MTSLARRLDLAHPPHRTFQLAAEPSPPWRGEADPHGSPEPVPPASLPEARSLRDALAGLLGRERAAAADFLLALADFDRRRGWEALGHASLFAFLQRELRLSNGAAYLRSSAAALLPRFPEVEAALRGGALCLSAVGELARVITEENRAEVLPRFLGRSFREAREVAAALVPRKDPPRRESVTRIGAAPAARPLAGVAVGGEVRVGAEVGKPTGLMAAEQLRAHELTPPASGTAPTTPAAPTQSKAPPPTTIEPLDADLRRLHLTISKRLLDKVARARDGLSHALPGATTEQVLEAALDLLLEHQARRKALVKRPRVPKGVQADATTTATPATPTPTPAALTLTLTTPLTAPKAPTAADPRHIPAAIEREVRLRDGDRCQFPLDAGGVCDSTWCLELDHVVPVAQGGPTSVANLRVVCRPHNLRAAALALGEVAASQRRPRGGAS
jgi:5-methylcytosine-specific restriction endonuclease McrA